MNKYLIFLWIIYIVIDAVVSWYLIEKKKVEMNQMLFHILSTIVRGWFFVLIGIAVNVTSQTLFAWILFTTTSFWVLFDLLLNIFRGRGVFYIGVNAKIDRFGNDFPIIYWGLKILALSTSVIIGYFLIR